MKAKTLLTGLLTAFAVEASSQALPSYTMDYVLNNGGMGAEWAQMLDTWEPGKPYSLDENYVDDNFFISRVRPRTRIVNRETQVNASRNDDRKMLWWCPIGESSKVWGPFPRYNFDADNFSMWQYLDYHGNWSNGWIRVPGAFNDAAHKNGVETGCLIFFEGSSDPNLPKLVTKVDGKFKYVRKFVQMLKYYGIDGVGVNPEGSLGMQLANDFQDFFAACHEEAENLNWHFKVIWYESQSNSGGVSWTDQLSNNNKNWFSKDEKTITDVFFLNYNWNVNKLQTSKTTAESLGRSTYDVYAGMDIEGRGLHNNGGDEGGWKLLEKQPFSVGIWGSHADNIIHKGSNESGSSDLAIQNQYQTKLEMFFSGGKRNPADLPAISNARRGFSLSDLQTFHGIEAFINAKSTLNQLPFVTRFNLGNGQFFKNAGETTFPKKWYNLGMQDFLPTWRWWITNGWGTSAAVPTDAIGVNFSFDDAWYGGSCLKLHGATAKSDIRLFKTDFVLRAGDKISLTYKMVNGGLDPKASICVSKVGSENDFTSYKLPNVTKVGEWYTATVNLSDLKLKANDKIACIGLEMSNTVASHELLLGEVSIADPNEALTPAGITINHVEVLGGLFNTNDVKVTWTCGDKSFNEAESVPVYNDDVNVWFFEIYTRASDSETPVLCTATTSWAAYVIGAPATEGSEKVEIGVCAVNPNGQRSAIVWSKPMERKVVALETVSIDKPVVKPNQDFTVSFDDATHAASTFVITNSVTGTEVLKKENVKGFTAKLEEEGFYDLAVGTGDKPLVYRGFIQITPEATGGLSEITELKVSKAEAKTAEEVIYSYEGSKRDGTVSRGLHLADVEAFTIPADVCSKIPFSLACWVKLDENVLTSNEGTTFFNQRRYTDQWPQSDWGDSWLDFRDGKYLHACLLKGANVNNPGYCITPGVWAHVAMTVNEAKTLTLYLNGKEIASGSQSGTTFRGVGTCYFGSSAANRSGFMGVLDEIQFWNKALSAAELHEAMEGYDPAFGDMPTELVGYWKFEDGAFDTETGDFFNEGALSSVVAHVTTRKDNDDITYMSPQFVAGVPTMQGMMDVTTVTTWNLPGASITKDGENAKATYEADGVYDAKVTLENVYGKVEKEVKEIIVISSNPDAIQNTPSVEMSIYPNPFTESANLLFDKGGDYTITVYSPNGTLVNSTPYNVNAGDVKKLTVDGKGMFFVSVIKDGKTLKAFKIIKE